MRFFFLFKSTLKSQLSEVRCQLSAVKPGGFTAVEMLFVLGAVTVLTSLLILYNRVGQGQLILFTEKTQLVSTIYQARTLSIQTFTLDESERPCGYGIHFVNDTSYILYKNFADAALCSNLDRADYNATTNDMYDSGRDETVQTFVFDQAVKFSPGPSSDILFTPPDPVVRPDNMIITLATTDGSATETITLSNFGQLSI